MMPNDVEEGSTIHANLIERTPLFASLPTDEIEYISRALRQRWFEPGEILFSEGDPGDRFSIVLEGQVEIIKALGTTEGRTLAVLGPGEMIGEMSLLYRNKLRSASARAQTQVHMLEMTQADFDALLHRRPELALGIMQEMSERMRNSEDATIRDLQEKNRQLAAAYRELQAAQAQIIEKEKLEHELSMARRIQSSILPKETPVLDGWKITAHWQPARAVSGDFYDFIPFPKGKWGLVIGDVTDKGVPAALVMATTRSVIRSTALSAAALTQNWSPVAERLVSPGEILTRVNNLLYEDMPSNMFVTCLFAVLDPATGRLRFSNAGHNLPCLRTPKATVELRATGMPLGLMPDMNYEEKEAYVVPGSLALFYSDGLVEAHNPQREMYGVPRLQKNLAGSPGGASLIKELLTSLADFTGPRWEQEDDVTLMTLERVN
jgi:serine phosphatase RsbU (regulator of sigma subunit)